ncbi:MAG TPA: EamA family transporter, partial [Ramlibacter sp.]
LVVVGVLCTGVAYILYFRLIEEAGPARALAVTFVVPVFAVIYGAAFLHEAVTHWMLICGGVIVCGTALATGLLAFGKRPS